MTVGRIMFLNITRCILFRHSYPKTLRQQRKANTMPETFLRNMLYLQQSKGRFTLAR